MEVRGGGYCPSTAAVEEEELHAAAGEHFEVEDLLNFPDGDAVNDGEPDAVTGSSGSAGSISTSLTASSEPHVAADFGRRDTHFSGDIAVPYEYDDAAELEWLSNFVEESFCGPDEQRVQLLPDAKVRPMEERSESDGFGSITGSETDPTPPTFGRGKARSKRSRAAACRWKSRLLVLSPAALTVARKEARGGDLGYGDGDGRKCLHCATDRTPQWRTGPMGPKTLCNACGVRYKSGRLVPEYRPAASPTFLLTKHSNSHRKVMELRRQKEAVRSRHHPQPPQLLHPGMIFDASHGEEYLIHQPVGPDFRQLI